MHADRIQSFALQAAWAAGFALLFFLVVRAWPLRALYLSPVVRTEARSALSAMREDTGWGLSNFELQSVACTDNRCEIHMDFRIYAPAPYGRRHPDISMTWPKGSPERYALSERP